MTREYFSRALFFFDGKMYVTRERKKCKHNATFTRPVNIKIMTSSLMCQCTWMCQEKGFLERCEFTRVNGKIEKVKKCPLALSRLCNKFAINNDNQKLICLFFISVNGENIRNSNRVSEKKHSFKVSGRVSWIFHITPSCSMWIINIFENWKFTHNNVIWISSQNV